jgi:hypothetical protein
LHYSCFTNYFSMDGNNMISVCILIHGWWHVHGASGFWGSSVTDTNVSSSQHSSAIYLKSFTIMNSSWCIKAPWIITILSWTFKNQLRSKSFFEFQILLHDHMATGPQRQSGHQKVSIISVRISTSIKGKPLLPSSDSKLAVFYCFRVFGPLMKHEKRVVYTTSQTKTFHWLFNLLSVIKILIVVFWLEFVIRISVIRWKPVFI